MAQFRKDRLSAVRKKVGLSGQKFAELVGVDRMTIYRWEKGTVKPSLDNILSLCKATGKSVEYFTGGGK